MQVQKQEKGSVQKESLSTSQSCEKLFRFSEDEKIVLFAKERGGFPASD